MLLRHNFPITLVKNFPGLQRKCSITLVSVKPFNLTFYFMQINRDFVIDVEGWWCLTLKGGDQNFLFCPRGDQNFFLVHKGGTVFFNHGERAGPEKNWR